MDDITMGDKIMAIQGDLREKRFHGKKMVYAEIQRGEIPPYDQLILHAERPANAKGKVIRLHKNTIKELRKYSAYNLGWILRTKTLYRIDQRIQRGCRTS